MTKETVDRLERTQMRMLRWMTVVSLKERRTSESIRQLFGVEPIEKVARQMRLRWFRYTERRVKEPITQKCQKIEDRKQ